MMMRVQLVVPVNVVVVAAVIFAADAAPVILGVSFVFLTFFEERLVLVFPFVRDVLESSVASFRHVFCPSFGVL
jgi:hypothetical protein